MRVWTKPDPLLIGVLPYLFWIVDSVLLGDSFDRKIDKEPTQLADNLYAMEIDTVYESGEYDTIIVDCAPTGET